MIDEIVARYTKSWINDNRTALRRLLAVDAEIEWNLDAPVDDEELVQTLHRIAVFADAVTIVSRVCADDGAALIYDLVAPFGTARVAEFLAIEGGHVTEVRHIYDVTALDRYFPGLYDN